MPRLHSQEPDPEPGDLRRSLRRRLALLAGVVIAVFGLTALATRGDWELAAMVTVVAAVGLLVAFVALGGLSGARRNAEPPPPVPLPKPEKSGAADGSGTAGPTSALADRYYFKGAWFTITVHPEDSAGHRIDLAGPLCPVCHEPMLRAHEREPLEKVDDLRAEVYKCRKSTVHPLVTVQLTGEDRLVDQARSACLHEMASGRFDSLPAEGGPGSGEEEPKADAPKPEPPKPGAPKPPARTDPR